MPTMQTNWYQLIWDADGTIIEMDIPEINNTGGLKSSSSRSVIQLIKISETAKSGWILKWLKFSATVKHAYILRRYLAMLTWETTSQSSTCCGKGDELMVYTSLLKRRQLSYQLNIAHLYVTLMNITEITELCSYVAESLVYVTVDLSIAFFWGYKTWTKYRHGDLPS